MFFRSKTSTSSKSTGPMMPEGGSQGPILIEAFTSQGCSSCPPGDALLSKLGQGRGEHGSAPIIVLAYHVDYWDYLGWKDPFSNPKWTVRQRGYGRALQQKSIYTPEVVVQGRNHGVASNSKTVMSLVQAAPRFPAPEIHAMFTKSSPTELKVSLTVTLKFAVDSSALDVMVAIYRNGLVTNCSRGENRGSTLTNDFVVTGLQKACSIQNLPAERPVKGAVTFQLWDGFSKDKSGVVVFIQNPLTLEVFGAQHVDWTA